MIILRAMYLKAFIKRVLLFTVYKSFCTFALAILFIDFVIAIIPFFELNKIKYILFKNVFHHQTLFIQKKIILKVLDKQENIYLTHL